MKASLGSVDWKLKKSWPPGQGGATNGRAQIFKKKNKSKSLYIFSETNQPGKTETYVNSSTASVDSRLFARFDYNLEGV